MLFKLSTNSFIEQVDSFFTKIFSSFKDIISWTTFGILLVGILIGFVLCFTIYGIILLKSINQKEKEIEVSKDIDEKEIKDIVDEIKRQFVEETEGLQIKDKFEVLGNKIYETIIKIASKYYPESKYPLYELTIEELIIFLQYLSNRIDGVFDKWILKSFKKISISKIFALIDAKKKIDETRAAKLVKKANSKGIIAGVKNVVGLINPMYWLKKLTIGSTVSFATRKICLIIIDIVADETVKTYSKSLFNEEKELKLLEIDKALEELEKEELDA